MSHEPSYRRNPYLRELSTEAHRVEDDNGRRFAVLADTIFYPEGGGQPPDHGHIGDAAVNDVQSVNREIRHYFTGDVATGPVILTLDWERRFDHMQHHTGQHLLSAIADDRFGWKTTAFHLGSELCDVELDARAISPPELVALEDAVADVIRAARAVQPLSVSLIEFGKMTVRTRGLPDDFEGDVRLIEIEGIDRNTCGGTHLRSTSEIETLQLVATERLRGGVRVMFTAGRRARRRAAAHEARNAELRALLGTADADLTRSIGVRLEAERTAAKALRALGLRLAELEADRLAASVEPVIAAHFDSADSSFLQLIARRLSDGDKVVLLTAGAGNEGPFVLSAGARTNLNLKELGAKVAAILGGRGGGAGQVFQGKATTLDRRAEALALLRAI